MVTRRKLLKIAAATGMFVGMSKFVRAQDITTIEQGASKLYVINDGYMKLPMNFVFGDVPQVERERLLLTNSLSLDLVEPPCNVTVLETTKGLVVFDVGGGTNFMPTLGRFFDAFLEAGFDPEKVTDVVFTHAHPDHLWGIIDDFDEVIFPDARMHIAQSEFEFWMAEDTLSKMSPERQSFAVGARNRLKELEEQFEFFKFGDEILPGVEAIDTSGHTTGHASFSVHHGGETTMIVGDALTHPVISFERPHWPSGSDHDVAKGIATRQKLLDRLAGEKTRLIGYHLTNAGVGFAERYNGAYRFVGV